MLIFEDFGESLSKIMSCSDVVFFKVVGWWHGWDYPLVN